MNNKKRKNKLIEINLVFTTFFFVMNQTHFTISPIWLF
jgi:hypothetical protein